MCTFFAKVVLIYFQAQWDTGSYFDSSILTATTSIDVALFPQLQVYYDIVVWSVIARCNLFCCSRKCWTRNCWNTDCWDRNCPPAGCGKRIPNDR